MFHDRPLKPLDNAVYWIEYVVRHNGAHHLKTAGNSLNWIQFLCLDVVIVILSCLFLCLTISFCTMKKVYSYYIKRNKSNPNVKNNHKKNN